MEQWGINNVGNQFTELGSENPTALSLAYQSELQEEDQPSGIIQQTIVMGT